MIKKQFSSKLTIDTYPLYKSNKRKNHWFNLIALLLASALFGITQSAQGQINGAEYNLKLDFGAVGDGVANDSPALQAAFDALETSGGGTLIIPAGKYSLQTPVVKIFQNNASSVTIRGVGSASQLMIKSGPGTENIRFDGLERLTLSHLTFVGTPGVSTDAYIALSMYYCYQAVIEHCGFYGLASADVRGGSVVYAHNSDLKIRDSSFRGCTGNSGLGNPVIFVDRWIGLSVYETDFIDYGTLNGIGHSKQPIALSSAWIQVGGPLKLDNAMGQNAIILRGVRMDEGAWGGLIVYPNIYGSTERVAQVHLSGVRVNVSSADLASGFYIIQANQVTIENCWLGYNSYERTAIRLVDAGTVSIQSVQASNGKNGRLSLEADAATKVALIDSSFDSIKTSPEQTVIIKDLNQGFGFAATSSSTPNSSNAIQAPLSKTPTGSNDPSGNVGDIVWDNNYVYVKTSTGWKRSSLGSW